MASILLIDDEEALTDHVRRELESHEHAVECLDRAEEGPDRLASGRFDIVLLDNKMPGMTGIEFLEAVEARGLGVPVILMTGVHSSLTAIRAKKFGAVLYVIKPDTHQSLVRSLLPLIEQVLQTGRLSCAAAGPRPEPGAPAEPELVGSSEPMLEVYDRIGLFADGGDTILIQGETGTGKELVARAIHGASPRKDRPFVALNCSAIAQSLLENELFGHEKGAFTGATELQKGLIEHANGGTLFLDEIGDLPLEAQAKLLRVLQQREVQRVGGTTPVKVDVRVLAATFRDLRQMVREEKFRRDLFFRLDGVTIRLPPLRDRLGDLPELVNGFVAGAAAEANRPRPTVAPETLERLIAHPQRWPGNVRELENVIHRAVRLCRGPQLLPVHIDFQTDTTNAVAPTAEAEAIAGLHKAIEWGWSTNLDKLWPRLRELLERELLKVALDRLDGNKAKVSERLDMALNTIRKRMEEYDLKENVG